MKRDDRRPLKTNARIPALTAKGKTLVAAFALTSSLAISGCSSSPPAPDPLNAHREWSRDLSATADVDPIAGTITLPLDQYKLTLEETATLVSARSLAINLCARERGVNGDWQRIPPNNAGERRYGVWVKDLVEQFGYDLPPSNVTVSNNSEPDANPIYEACSAEDPDIQQFDFDAISPAFDTVGELSGLSEAALASEDAELVFTDWEACLKENGLERDTSLSPFAVAGAGLEPTSSNISIALTDIDCKANVDYIQRLANIQASFEKPIVDEYSDELVAARSEYDAMVELANQYLSANSP